MINQINLFLKHKTIEGCSESTINNYKYNLLNFRKWAFRYLKRPPKVTDIDKKIVIRYLETRQVGNNTMAKKIGFLSLWFDFLVAENEIAKNPIKTLKRPRMTKKPIEYLSPLEIKKLIRTLWHPFENGSGTKNEAFPGRDLAIISLMIGTGIRSAELRTLTIDCVDIPGRRITIKRKGGNIQRLPFSDSVAQALAIYHRNRVRIDRTEIYFLSNYRTKMSSTCLANIVNKWLIRAGITKSLTPHKLRHSFACYQIKHGTTIEVLKKLLGHQSIASTMVYIHSSLEEEIEAVNKMDFLAN